jgi:hypothetical protein
MNTTNNMGAARSARWARLPASPYFHVVDCDRPYSIVTLCAGSWSVDDECVEWMSSPPHEERCACCQRRLIDPIERGLAELVNNTDLTDRFDLSGEA